LNLQQFLNGVRVLMCINQEEFLACINKEDRLYFGDQELSNRFFKNPHRCFCELPTQDQERLFAIIAERNAKAGLG